MDPPPPPPTASSSPPSTPTSQSSTPSASRTALARKKKAIRSNFDAQYDHLLQTVIKNDTGSTTRDWQPTQSTRNPSSKASEAAYKGWVSRRGITPAIPSPAVPVAFPAPQLQPFQLPIPTPTPRARGLSYVPLPAGHGALGLVRGANQPIGANEQDQKLSDEAQAQRATLVIEAEQERQATSENAEENEDAVPESDAKSDAKESEESGVPNGEPERTDAVMEEGHDT
ncbi:hypothetical protein CLAFUW4_10168 [Fulvia fulva]|uniref:Uncharacterized protein n=1 Tax=Passalora fulva TaxID=5499 RepID=A0A9Q8LEG2_PASFU|nr:uncharacterized protein CLAFUR5_04781 [Fulvia fulva]KAK4615480.1 hypothetical protein CLAFUR4_10172 [Fulvia fulva]KAK4616609.1 hypothetical protein CLAFUR0_10170 [Fulvia fulva]UJO15952.1 hypothetical protein CLAFUR5_04781 [Fulvia fulva]WPV19421.1 hypothetical protein CLAFUW4_10168 [Fulvia fulva]WPV34245.1 hypothetical protein CLAFUW7_10168 [Fulvia fulva]